MKEAYSTLERTKAEYTDNLEYGSLNNKVFRLTKPNIAKAFGNIKFSDHLFHSKQREGVY